MLVPVSELITRAQQAADMEDDFISQDTWVAWANAENRELYNRIARSGYPINVVSESITATGATEYNITEPAAVIGIKGLSSSYKFYRIPIKHPSQAKTIGNVRVGTPTEAYVNCFPGEDPGSIQITFYPNPASGTYLVDTIGRPSTLAISGDPDEENVAYPVGLEERIVLGMARRALGKEETTNPAIERMIFEADKNVDNFVHSYLMAESPTVRDMNELERTPPFTEWIWV